MHSSGANRPLESWRTIVKKLLFNSGGHHYKENPGNRN